MHRSTHAGWLTLSLLALALGLGGCKKKDSGSPDGVGKPAAAPAGAGDKPSFAFVTNGVDPFWTIAQAGADQAGSDLGVSVTTIMPSNITDQTRKLEDLLTRGTQGIAISPINPENQGEAINKAAAATNLVTHDSDAPESDRLLYIGMDNYKAGLMAGELTRKALPEGGKVMIFIGRLDQDNAKRRRQGTIDAILGREPDATRYDPPGGTLTSEDGKYIILGTMTDNFDRAKAKANAEDALTRDPDIAAMVGLFAFNPPAIAEGLDRAGKLGKVKIIGFDENDVTLQGIKDGVIVGTVVQNPYMYGYKSVEVLHALHKGDRSVIPASKNIDIAARVIDQSNVDEFWADLKKKTGKE